SFQLRALTGTFAPTGSATVRAAITALGSPMDLWNTQDPGVVGVASVMSKWSSGGEDRTGHRMMVHGGGHADSAFNGLPTFDFSGSSKPAGWVIEPNSLSPIAQVPTVN